MGATNSRGRRWLGPLALLTAVCLACAGADSLLAPRARPEVARIRVESGDIADEPYLLLGTVEWRSGSNRYQSRRCTPDRLREQAVEIYGDRVDGIVHFATWMDGSISVCSGTAVQFSEGR